MSEFISWTKLQQADVRCPQKALRHLISSMTSFDPSAIIGQQQDALLFFTAIAGREPRTETPGMLF